ncbi:MAG TPA: hypothetical protein VFZ93_09800 [Albitalea sp.]
MDSALSSLVAAVLLVAGCIATADALASMAETPAARTATVAAQRAVAATAVAPLDAETRE